MSELDKPNGMIGSLCNLYSLPLAAREDHCRHGVASEVHCRHLLCSQFASFTQADESTGLRWCCLPVWTCGHQARELS